MIKEVFKIDENGYIIEKHVVEFDKEGNPLEELGEDIITVTPPDGLYRAKWTGIEWIEDMSQEEIDELNKQPEKEPSEIEILGQEITMLKLSNITKDNIINTLGQELTSIKLQLLQGGM
jgi:hypothetical protein